MGPSDAELAAWLFTNVRIKALIDAGLLLVATEPGTADGMPFEPASRAAQPGLLNIPKEPLTPEQRAVQRRMNQGIGPSSEPAPWWCDVSDPAVMAANIAATAVFPAWLFWLGITCHEDEVAGPTVQIARQPGPYVLPAIHGSSMVTLALAHGGVVAVTLDTPAQLVAARKAAYAGSLKDVLPPGTRLVVELLWRVLKDQDLSPIGFSEFESSNAQGVLVPRAALLSPAEALRLWLRRIGLALYTELYRAGPSADTTTGRVQSLTTLSRSEYLCLVAPVIAVRSGAPSQDLTSVHGLIAENPQNLKDILDGPLQIAGPPPSVSQNDWPLIFGMVPRINAQLLFCTDPVPGQPVMIFPGGFWDVNPLTAQTAAIVALLEWKGSQDAAIVEAQAGPADLGDAGAIRSVRATKRWLAEHFDSQGYCAVDYYEAARGKAAMPKESWSQLVSLSSWSPAPPKSALVSPGRIWAAKGGPNPLMLLEETLQALEISVLRACNCPARLARLAPIALETLVASTNAVMTGYGIRSFAPPAYFGVLTPWLWKAGAHVAQMVLPGLQRISLGPMTRHSPIGWLRDPLLVCMGVQAWWDMHPVRTLGDMGPVTLAFDNTPGQSTAGPIMGNVQGMLQVQQAQGINWQEICAPIWNRVIDDFLETAFSRFDGALISKGLLPKSLHAQVQKWAAQKLPSGWQPEPNQLARWRQSFFEFSQTNGVVPADIAQAPGFGVLVGLKDKASFAEVVQGPCDDIVKAAMAPSIEAEEKCYNSAKALNPNWDQSKLDEACRQFEAYYLPPPFWPGSILRDSTTVGIDAFASAAAVVLAP